jgi:hypothetical protein
LVASVGADRAGGTCPKAIDKNITPRIIKAANFFISFGFGFPRATLLSTLSENQGKMNVKEDTIFSETILPEYLLNLQQEDYA